MSILTTFAAAGTQKYLICVGDSITWGFENNSQTGSQVVNGGYRLKLQRILLSENRRVYFMGEQLENSIGMSDPWHMGIGGQITTQIAARMAGYTPPFTPDVIVAHMGTNDVFYNAQLAAGTLTDPTGLYPISPTVQTLANLGARHTTAIDAWFTRWPSVKIVCVKIGHYLDGTSVSGPNLSGLEGLQNTFNTYLDNLPGSHAKGAQIRIVDAPSTFTVLTWYGDGAIHPNDQGYLQLAVKIWGQLSGWV